MMKVQNLWGNTMESVCSEGDAQINQNTLCVTWAGLSDEFASSSFHWHYILSKALIMMSNIFQGQELFKNFRLI